MSANINVPRILVAAPHSGAGKTTVTMGLAAWLSREMTVRPFKVGPDYIDPGYLEAGAGSPAINLDGWLLTKDRVKQVFFSHSQDSDIALIEGVMGLFDGRGAGSAGSAAQIARWLDVPILLVVDAARAGRSLAALVSGFRGFDKKINIAGVFLNRIGSQSHLAGARDSIEKYTGIPVVGHLPNDPALAAPSRHLGLIQSPRAELESLARCIASTLAATTDRARLLAIAAAAGPVDFERDRRKQPVGRKLIIGVARDEAFSFYYHDNLSLLKSLGAEIAFFSPLADARVPDGADGLIFGGGWPELYAGKLAGNHGMRRSILKSAGQGLPIYAECGGLIYLTKSLTDQTGPHAMVGLLPATAMMTGKRQGLGYRQAKFRRSTILGGKGMAVRGHEFHWSVVTESPAAKSGRFEQAYIYNDGRLEGFASDKVLASYLHLNWNGRPELAENFINSCLEARTC
ncbi:MAG: cobyrinate a,c-diamide synthase [Actinomycetota bacterium]|nr:cobyrinate a,c-diamide synthase [Actinomycetota bacterium]